jgi:hypothetical protein
MTEPRHCDSYINDPNIPRCLQWFIFWFRHSASDKHILSRNVEEPKLFAKWKNDWIRVVMVSRMGDVGISYNMDLNYGYSDRVYLSELTNFTSVRPKFDGKGNRPTES